MAPSSAGGSCCACTRVTSWTTRVTMACFFLAEGIEFSVILPTMWDYLRGLGGQEWLYGLSLAAFSISDLFTSPLYGFVFDKTHRTKLIVLFAGLFQIGGNLQREQASTHHMHNVWPVCSNYYTQQTVPVHVQSRSVYANFSCRKFHVFLCHIQVHDLRKSFHCR